MNSPFSVSILLMLSVIIFLLIILALSPDSKSSLPPISIKDSLTFRAREIYTTDSFATENVSHIVTLLKLPRGYLTGDTIIVGENGYVLGTCIK